MDKIERIINCADLLPTVSRDSNDIQEIMRIESLDLQELWDTMVSIFYNQWIVSMNDYGLRQWESMLDLTPKTTDTLDNRRREILKALYGLRPFTFKSFQAMLDAAYGAGNVKLELLNDKYELWFSLTPNTVYKRNDIYNFAEPIVPKNLIIFFKNEKEVQASPVYICGVVTVRSIVTISPDTGVSIPNLSCNEAISGFVTIRTIINIMGEGG